MKETDVIESVQDVVHFDLLDRIEENLEDMQEDENFSAMENGIKRKEIAQWQ